MVLIMVFEISHNQLGEYHRQIKKWFYLQWLGLYNGISQQKTNYGLAQAINQVTPLSFAPCLLLPSKHLFPIQLRKYAIALFYYNSHLAEPA